MKAKLLLAETAASHPDGTISLLRMGITHVWGEKLPLSLDGALVVRIEATMIDIGEHDMEILSMDADANEFAPRVKGKFEVPKGGGNVNVILKFSVKFPKFGEYTFAAVIDKGEQDRLSITAASKKEKGG